MASERLEEALNMVSELKQNEIAGDPPDVSEVLLNVPTERRWTCPGCTDVENRVLNAFQERGIKDKNALAVLMGNVKQESNFNLDICEGGVRTGYHNCHRGGFGLIQWTTVGRYNGLGRTARQHQLDPNSLDAQLKWLFNEVEWKSVENRFKTEGQTVTYYMNAAYRWLGWGIHGNRTAYSYKYLNYFHLK